MPVETMDQRNMSSFYKPAVPSSLFSGEIYLPSEKHVGFWKTASMSGHRGLDVMTNMLGGKPVSSLPLENMKNNFLDNKELSQNFSKEPQTNIHFDKPLMDPLNTTNSQRTPNIDAASQKVGMKTGYYDNSLFSSSMSDLFNRTRGLTLNSDLVHQLANTVQSNLVDDEPFKCSEEIEAQAIGDLLPDDDDLLFDAIHNQGSAPQSNWTDTEDDLFCSVGGLELESDDNIKSRSQIDYSRIFNCQEGGMKKPQPSRMLVVRNVDSNIDDAELKILLEQFGDLQAFHTFYRHQGIIVASYYDIRAAQNAERMLRAMIIMGKKLDIQFYVPKQEIHSENQTCDGVVLITNVDSLHDEVLSIFSQIGEIKDTCEFPQYRQYKIIEFYDVRAADTALSALNGYEIAGKRIKVEPLRLRDSRLRSMQKLTMDIEFEELGRCRQEIYPEILPSECYGTSTGHQNGAIHGSITSRNFGMSSNIPHKIPSQATFSVIGKNNSLSGNCGLSHSLGNPNLNSQSMPSFPKINGVLDGMQFSSPSTVSAVAMNMNSSLVANGNDSGSINRSGSFAHSDHFEHNKSAYNSGIGSFPPHSHDHIWNDSGIYHNPGSLPWQNMQPFVYSNSIPIQTPYMLHGLSRGPSHIPNHLMTPNHHGGSAPSISFHPNSLGSVEYSSFSPLHLYNFSSQNTFPSMGVLNLESSISSTRVETPLPHSRAHVHRTKSNMSTSRGRRSHSHVNQSDNSGQYDLDIDRIARGEELRTTLMIKNIPNKYTSKMLLATIDEQHKGTYDFIYLPIDFKNKCNVGYAFINMTDPQHIIPFYQVFNGKKWEKFNSGKVAYLAYARIQGKSALIGHFQNSSLMNEDKRCRPILFRTEGPNAGEQEPFPVPAGANTRIRRSRTNTKTNQGSMSGSSSDDESPNSAKDSE